MNSNKRCGFYRTVVGKTYYTSKIFFIIIFSILIIGEKKHDISTEKQTNKIKSWLALKTKQKA